MEKWFSLITTITEWKITEGEDMIEVSEWSNKQEDQLKVYNDLMDDIENFCRWPKVKEEERAIEKEAHQGKVRRQSQRQEEWITRQKMVEWNRKRKGWNNKKDEQQKEKLQKLQISNFDDTVKECAQF